MEIKRENYLNDLIGECEYEQDKRIFAEMERLANETTKKEQNNE